ncbi:MAG: hypothetical protein AB8B85_18130 [Paracoccaceae bacterium]
MLVRNTFIAALLSLAICPAMAADTSAPSEAAMAFVGQFSDDHLSGMLSRVGASQPAMMAAGQFNGSLLAVVFDAEIDKAVTEYGPEWQRAMASSWTGLMTDEQFTSLTNDGADSPYSDTYLGLRSTAGAQMQQNAGDLFRKILSQVVGNTFKELGAHVPTPSE